MNAIYCDDNDQSKQGYIDTLRHLGHKVYVCNPKTKAETKNLIDEHDVGLIFASSPFDILHLPASDAGVVIRPDPEDKSILDVVDIIKDLNSLVCTPFEEDSWDTIFGQELTSKLDMAHIPYAANILRCLPEKFGLKFNVCITADDMGHNWVQSLIKRLEINGWSYGECHYANAQVVVDLVRDNLDCLVPEKSFSIPLSCGVQVTNSKLMPRYLGNHVMLTETPYRFISHSEHILAQRLFPDVWIRNGVKAVAGEHTYFNRLADIFTRLGMESEADKALKESERLATKYAWDVETLIESFGRGVNDEPRDKALTGK